MYATNIMVGDRRPFMDNTDVDEALSWLRAALTTYGDQRAAQERNRFHIELDQLWVENHETPEKLAGAFEDYLQALTPQPPNK